MDDFLHNLRKNTEKQYDRRKQYNNPQYRGPDRRGPRDHHQQQRRPYQKRNELQELLSEVMPGIKGMLEKLDVSMNKIAGSMERRAQAQERQADVFEDIAASLRQLVETRAHPVPETVAEPVTYSPEKEDMVSSPELEAVVPIIGDRDGVVDLIISLREGGMTYKEVAQHLEDEKIPTFSGKGAWHAQTVHKVCKKGA